MIEFPYFIESERLLFRTWGVDDLKLAVGLWGDIEVTKLFDNRGKLTDTQVEERLGKEIESQQKYGVQYWPIFEKTNKQHIGAAGLRPKSLNEKQYELGFHICSKQWGKGYASEAILSVIDYAKIELNALSLFAGHNPQNKISQHLLMKFGFIYTHEEFYKPTGLMHPSYILEIK